MSDKDEKMPKSDEMNSEMNPEIKFIAKKIKKPIQCTYCQGIDHNHLSNCELLKYLDP